MSQRESSNIGPVGSRSEKTANGGNVPPSTPSGANKIHPNTRTRRLGISLRRLIVITGLLMLAIVMLGAWTYRTQENDARKSVYANLQAIGELKANQVAAWRAERLGDAGVLQDSGFFLAAVTKWLSNPDDALSTQLLNRCKSLQTHYHYHDVVIADLNGQIRLSASGDRTTLTTEERAAINDCLQTRKPTFSDFYFSANENKGPRLSVVLPISPGPESDASVICVILLQIDPSIFLYPLLSSWPIPSTTAESLLIRRDGDSVLFLNELRHKSGTALTLRIPLDKTDVPAVMAVLGTTGIVAGNDYRGVPVLSAIFPIEGSPWFLISKIDNDEAFSEVHFRSFEILMSILALILLLLLGALTIHQYGKANILQAKLQAEQAILAERERSASLQAALAATQGAILDALPAHVALLDAEGCVVTVNEGWRRFGAENALPDPDYCLGRNYLEVCENAAGSYSEEASKAAHGIRKVLAGELNCFELEYSCHSPTEQQWFRMRVAPLKTGHQAGAVVMHVNVTDSILAQDALRESEAQYRALFENLHSGAAICDVILDADGKPVDFINVCVNATHEKQSGLKPDQILGRRITEVLPEEEVAPLIVRYGSVVLSGEPIHMEHYQPSLHRYFDVTAYKIAGCRIAVLFQDITERKNSEDALQKSEARYRTLVENIPQNIMIRDLDSHYVSINENYAKLLNVSAEEVVGKNDFDFFPRELAEKYRDDDKRVMETGQTLEFDEDYDEHGKRMWIHTLKAPVRDTAGKIVGVLATFWDVTEHRLAEEKIHLQAAALETAANGIVITDVQGTIEWVNPAFSRLTGYSSEEAIGKNPRDLVKSDVHDDAFYKEMWETILAGRDWQGEITNRRKDGTLYTEVQTITPVRNRSGELSHFVGVKIDVTDRKKLEQELRQAQKMESIGHLAGGIAHDFNNLLTVISGYTEMALGAVPEDEDLHRDLTQVYKASERAATLTRQLLAFSRKQVLRPEKIDLNQVILDCTKMLKRLVGEDIAFQLKPGEELWPVMADPGQIEQIVMNLVVNARDAMPRGGSLVIETHNVDLDENINLRHNGMRQGRYVCLVVTDTGTGMDADTMEQIFEPFFTTKEVGKGTGLGLATVYGIIKQSGGEIYVYSEIGIGTAFKIYLPKAETDSQGTETQESECVALSGNETILLVEDEEPLRELTGRILTEAGFTVLSAQDAAEALQLAKQQQTPIHLVLTDVIMPGISGRELADRLHECHPEYKILFMSGYTDTAIATHGVLNSGTHLLSKPFTPRQLIKKIREILDAPTKHAV